MSKHYPVNPRKFEFDESVADIFPEMAVRSIPGYLEVYAHIEALLRQGEVPQYTQVWDFGCSAGHGLNTAAAGLAFDLVEFHGCDVSQAMVLKALGLVGDGTLVHLHDLKNGLPPALIKGKVGVAMFGWTLQFIGDQGLRIRLIKDAYDALVPGGYLFIMEKFRLEDYEETAAQQSYYKWRREVGGYTLAEIEAKSLALLGSMWPWPPEVLEQTLKELPGAKWSWLYRQFNFGGVVVRKG
jgi:tRNA (cmo5U34)-methyltransferase